MTDKDFLDAGFSQFPPTSFDHEGIETCFQKRYDDDIGKRYFITVHKWAQMKHPRTGEVFPASYEYFVQLYNKNTHDAVDLLFHSSWRLEDVENSMKNLFDTGLFDYYERFDE